jgi:hypothetical protein
MGSKNQKNRQWRPFTKARAYVRKLGLANNQEWRAYVRGEYKHLGKKPDDVPSNPNFVYAESGWAGYGDWLGNGNVSTRKRQYRPFNKARGFVRRLGLNSESDWRRYVKGEIKGLPKKPEDIPASPHMSYRNRGWKNYGDWLGTGNISYHHADWRSFNKARAYVRKLGLKNSAEWRKFCRGDLRKASKPADIPATPYKVYEGNGWRGMEDWLGNKKRK